MFLCLVFIFEIFESHPRRVLLRLALTVSRSLAEYIAVQAHLHCENAVVRRTVLADENVRLAASEEPVSVTFGTLEIAKGKTFTVNAGDKINLTSGTAGGGKLNIVTEQALSGNAGIELGTAPAGAWSGVSVRLNGRRGAVRETPVEGSSLVTCTVQPVSSLVLTIR